MSLIQSFQAFPALFVTAVTVMSLAIGSFLNVVIHRLPKMLERQWRDELSELNGQDVAAGPRYNLMVPRSACPACGHAIGALENVPLISYLALRGKCAGCKTGISPRYPLVEALTGALSGYIAWRYGFTWQTLALLVFVWSMIALAFIDLDTFYLPDDITLPLVWAGLLANMGGLFVDLQSAVIGAIAGYLALWIVFWGYKVATGKDGMGYGDFKLLAALGAWLGWQMVLPVVLGASVIGAVVGIAMKFSGALREGRYVPFGPFLAGAGVVVMLAGPERVLDWLGWA